MPLVRASCLVLRASVVVLLASCATHVLPPKHEARSTDHEARFDSPDAAAEFFAAKRGLTPETSFGVLVRAARDRMAAMQHFSTVADRVVMPRRGAESFASTSTLNRWTPLGPGNIGGRTRAIVFDPIDPNTMYAGAVSGGVWKSTNAGETWTAVGDELSNLAVCTLVIDPRDRNTLYAGTGEGYFREDVRGTALPIRGDGIYVTHDGGATWQSLAFTAGNSDFQWVNKLAISPHDSQRIYAATRSGVWRTADGGTTWKRVLSTTVKGGALDLAMRGDTDGDYLFATTGVFDQATIWRNKHAEQDGAWEAVLSEAGMSRTSLAIAPSNPSVIYALSASNNVGPQNTTQNLQAVYRSVQGGDAGSWHVQTSIDDHTTPVNRLLLSNAIAVLEPQCNNVAGEGEWVPMGWHCNVIAVDPTNADRVFAAGVDVFRSDDGGKSWGEASYWWTSRYDPHYLHADQHVLAFHPGYDGTANQTLYAANDGGIYRTDNALEHAGRTLSELCDSSTIGINWTPLNHDYGVTQFYFGAVSPDGRTWIGGAQDNGTLRGTTGDSGWNLLFGGDGAYVAIDPVETSTIYVEYQYGGIQKTTDGGNMWTPVSLPHASTSAQFLFVTPFALDPSERHRLWAGGTSMWRSNDQGDHFSAASTPLPGTEKFSALAIAPSRSDRIIAGTSFGRILRTDSAKVAGLNTTWPATQPRSGYVSSITFDRTNDSIAYATYAGFGGTHVWRTIDAGASWTALDGTGDGALPDIPVHALVLDPVHPHRIYISTDTGIFVSVDDGAHWLVEDSGFAPVITESLIVGANPDGGIALYAFTHGRGAWRADLATPQPKRRAVGH